MLKDISIGRITLMLTLLLSAVYVIGFVIIYLAAGTFGNSWLLWLSLLAVVILLIFLIIKIFVENYVLRKIMLIYKMIGDSKKHISINNPGNLDKMSINEVHNEVMEWALKTESDIADLKKLEHYRRNFLGNISHELKTPIFSIQGYIHTLLDGGVHDKNINIKYLRRAAANLDRLQHIVEDLEMINKLESGEVLLKIETFDLKVLVREVLEDMLFMGKDNDIKLNIKEGANSSFKVLGDRENIRQLFLNLIANGIKYGRKNGHVFIGFYDMDEKVLVEVEDDGIGIDKTHLNHIFDRFYRVDDSRSRKSGGSGLGLSIVKHILEAHNQTITVSSAINEGTTIGFTLDKA